MPKNNPGRIKKASSDRTNQVDKRCGNETEKYDSTPEIHAKMNDRLEKVTFDIPEKKSVAVQHCRQWQSNSPRGPAERGGDPVHRGRGEDSIS
jgi:hypothetical protein